MLMSLWFSNSIMEAMLWLKKRLILRNKKLTLDKSIDSFEMEQILFARIIGLTLCQPLIHITASIENK